jgi:hypothetical protein
MRTRTLVFLVAGSIAAFGVVGCGERPQELAQKRGYQGKPDSNPWDSDPSAALYTSSKWTKGDQASWEAAINQRTLSQNEYVRIQ